MQKLAALLGNIKHTWRLHGKRFTSWWASLDKEARLKFLLVGWPDRQQQQQHVQYNYHVHAGLQALLFQFQLAAQLCVRCSQQLYMKFARANPPLWQHAASSKQCSAALSMRAHEA